MRSMTRAWTAALFFVVLAGSAYASDLEEIKARGVLRHLGVPYANFVTGSGDGLDVEVMKLFAQHLGVKYEYVQTSWENVIADLSGKRVKPKENDIEIIGDAPVKGDIVANGFTILPWRQKLVDFSTPTFPNQVWVMAHRDSSMTPITPSGDTDKDIAAVKAQLKGASMIGVRGTCVDPQLYGMADAGAEIKGFEGTLNELVPAVINGEAETALQDVADALIALEKWPGQVKVIGPVSYMQNMGCAFPKSSPQLRTAFNSFYEQCKKDGTYQRIVMKYYPAVFKYYPDFFE